jgi:nucleoside-diphosphate-sugar epimerase
MRTLRYASLFRIRNFRFMEGDVRSSLWKLPSQQYSALFHLAAITDAEKSTEMADEVRANNLESTRKACEFCLERNIPLVFPSSTSVYGSQESRVDEDCPATGLRPQSAYAETKLQEERAVHEFRQKGLRCVILRLATIAGPSPGMRFHTAVNKFCWQAAQGQAVTVWKTALHQKRPYLALEDAVEAFLGAGRVLSEKPVPEVINVVTQNHTVNDILKMIRTHLPWLRIEMTENRIMNQLSYEVVSRYADSIGFCPAGSIERCIQETLASLPRSP